MSTFGSPISAIGSAAVLAGAVLLLVRRRLLRTYAVNLPDVHAELTAVHTRYEAALAENDVAALDELFFDHPATLRYGPDKSQHGYAAIAAMRASKKQPQGPRSEVVSKTITTFGSDFGTASIECRDANDPRLKRQQQTWLRTPAGWRVVAAHVSFAS